MRIFSATLAAILILASAQSARAAYGAIGVFTWNWSYPDGDLKNFIENDSWLGLTLEGRKFVKTNMTASLGFCWNEFHENTESIIELENGAISGSQYRDVNAFPMLVGAQYYFGEEGHLRPYIGLNAGAYYFDQMLDVGVFTYDAEDWHFGIAPQAGVWIPTANRDTRLIVDLRYHYPFEAGDYLGGESRSFSYWTVGLGFSWSAGRY